MGKFDALAKFLGLATKEYGDDAAKILSKVDSPELAVGLKGAERGQYLKALDEVYGESRKRAKDMGFDFNKQLQHGTRYPNEIKQFEIDKMKPGTLGKGVYTAQHGQSDLAKAYGENGQILNLISNESMPIKNANEILTKENLKVLKQTLDPEIYKQMENNLDLIPGNSTLRSVFRKISQNYKDVGLTDPTVDIANKFNISGIETPGREKIIFDPKNLRSINAAFDPRFKDSPLLMAGGLAGAKLPQTDMSPLGDIKKGLGIYEQAKEAVTKPLARQLNIANNPQDEAAFNTLLKTVGDPVNYIPGAAGIGASAMQILTPNEYEIKKQALDNIIKRGF